jgi:hypothetical protein
MPREILRLPYSTAELVLLRDPGHHYQLEIYWRQGGYYERLLETNNLRVLKDALLTAAGLTSLL